MNDLNKTWCERDKAVLWHPCTQMKDHEKIPLIPIRRAEGVMLEDFNGQRYIDAIGSWWVSVMGHCHPRISEAVKKQIDQLEHVMLAGFTHEPAIRLAEKLVEITPEGLSKCFYADNGSSGVEVALKMSYHYWRNTGNTNKRIFMTLDNSYHGETLGALSVSQVGLYKDTYKDLLIEVLNVPVADTYHQDPSQSYEAYADGILAEVEKKMQAHADETCALIVEPLIQCAGGMRMSQPYFLRKLFELTRKYNIHFIADEIAVGFGRTGTLFACEQAEISPDFLCLSKGLTGGYLPLCAVLTHDHIYNAFYDEYLSGKAFLHSHSYTGNPLAATAALATIQLLEDENIIEANQAKSHRLRELLAPLQDHPHVGQVRVMGMVAAVEMVRTKQDKTPYPFEERRGLRVYQHGLKHGVLLRPLGNVVYFMPPYIINDEQMQHMVSVARTGIDLATQD